MRLRSVYFCAWLLHRRCLLLLVVVFVIAFVVARLVVAGLVGLACSYCRSCDFLGI